MKNWRSLQSLQLVTDFPELIEKKQPSSLNVARLAYSPTSERLQNRWQIRDRRQPYELFTMLLANQVFISQEIIGHNDNFEQPR